MSDPSASTHRVAGRVRFRNFLKYREEGEAAIDAGNGDVTIDLSGLEHSNSLAVALLMAWYRAADQQDKVVRFVGVPAGLVDIVELSGLTEVLLPAQGAAASAGQSYPAEEHR